MKYVPTLTASLIAATYNFLVFTDANAAAAVGQAAPTLR